MIEIKNIKKNFKDHEVLKDVNISVARGSIYALLGPNGAGKSTLLKIITGLWKSDSGNVVVNGMDVTKNLISVQKLFSFSSQSTTVDGVLTGYENLHLIAKLRHLSNPNNIAEDMLEKFGLTDAKNKAVSMYSGGMRRRLDLAMSLVGDPEIIFLDEPTTGLDPKSRQELWGIIKELKNKGKTIFLTTQYLEEADFLADEIGFLAEGKIVAKGTPSEMKRMVGEDKLLIVFHSEEDVDKAMNILQNHQPFKKSEEEISIELSEEIETTLQVLNMITSEGIAMKSFHMVTPTLDDVFMTLSGGSKE